MSQTPVETLPGGADGFGMPHLEFYLKAMCEGFVDGEITSAYACANADLGVSALFDFTYPNLLFSVAQRPWMPGLPTVATANLPAINARPDLPKMFGPLVTLPISSEVWNIFAGAINALDRIRVPMPFQFLITDRVGANVDLSVGAKDVGGNPVSCTTNGTAKGVICATPGDSAPAVTVTWYEASTATSDVSVEPVMGSCPGGGLWTLRTNRTDHDYQAALVDPDALNAIPSAWRDMVTSNAELWAKITTHTEAARVQTVAAGSGDPCNSAGDYFSDGTHSLHFSIVAQSDTTTCGPIPATGLIRAPAPLPGCWEAGVNGLAYCTYPTNNTVTYTPIIGDTLLVHFPLADLPANFTTGA
jgi:hypothetical protein